MTHVGAASRKIKSRSTAASPDLPSAWRAALRFCRGGTWAGVERECDKGGRGDGVMRRSDEQEMMRGSVEIEKRR